MSARGFGRSLYCSKDPAHMGAGAARLRDATARLEDERRESKRGSEQGGLGWEARGSRKFAEVDVGPRPILFYNKTHTMRKVKTCTTTAELGPLVLLFGLHPLTEHY